MTTTLNENEDPGLSPVDALEYINYTMRQLVFEQTKGLRLGQIFFNALTPEDQEKLRGAFFDPFYRDEWPDVLRALRFLLEN